MKRIYIAKKESKWVSYPTLVTAGVSFFLGCVVTTTVIVNYKFHFTQHHYDLPSAQHQRSSIISSADVSSIVRGGGYDYEGTNSIMNQLKMIEGQQRGAVTSTHGGLIYSSSNCVNNNSNNNVDNNNSIQRRVIDGYNQEDILAGTSYPPSDLSAASSSSSSFSTISSSFDIGSILRNVHVLVVIVSYDFSQLPHLEEVLSSYHDVCLMGAIVDVHIHATIPYPVTLIDLLNSRINCNTMTITIVLKPKSLRLHLVDCHRETFYNNINKYDLFIYTEDDIRVTPTTVATYLYETKQIEMMLNVTNSNSNSNNNRNDEKLSSLSQYKPSDFNIGIVRFEYNYPANVIIDDNTRHATQNVTRVYWEHSGPYERPDGIVPNAVKPIPQLEVEPTLFNGRYLTMKNHHQGMYLATRDLLLEWKDRSSRCDFSNARDRPGTRHQPSQGTQRVWMSSQMLYGAKHCNVQQLLPVDKFGTLTVLHLPNKNYRRVGKYRNRTFSDGTEMFEQPHPSLLTAMQLHIGIRKVWPNPTSFPYKGITMIDEVNNPNDRTQLLDHRMEEYTQYVLRGGVLSENDMIKIDLVEEE